MISIKALRVGALSYFLVISACTQAPTSETTTSTQDIIKSAEHTVAVNEQKIESNITEAVAYLAQCIGNDKLRYEHPNLISRTVNNQDGKVMYETIIQLKKLKSISLRPKYDLDYQFLCEKFGCIRRDHFSKDGNNVTDTKQAIEQSKQISKTSINFYKCNNEPFYVHQAFEVIITEAQKMRDQ